jgi:hypothetical protein
MDNVVQKNHLYKVCDCFGQSAQLLNFTGHLLRDRGGVFDTLMSAHERSPLLKKFLRKQHPFAKIVHFILHSFATQR